MSLDDLVRVATAGIAHPPRPSEPPPTQVISRNLSTYEATKAAALEYYRKALTDWWAWRGGQALGTKFGAPELEQMRGDLVRFLMELVALGFARGGILPWRVVSELSLDMCVIAIDREHHPVRSPFQVGLDIEPLSDRLADYWMGVR